MEEILAAAPRLRSLRRDRNLRIRLSCGRLRFRGPRAGDHDMRDQPRALRQCLAVRRPPLWAGKRNLASMGGRGAADALRSGPWPETKGGTCEGRSTCSKRTTRRGASVPHHGCLRRIPGARSRGRFSLDRGPGVRAMCRRGREQDMSRDPGTLPEPIHPDPANPTENPRPGHNPSSDPDSMPPANPEFPPEPSLPGVPPQHPLGPPEPQP